MLTDTALQWVMSLGVGGVLAGGMFWVYRKDALAAAAAQQVLTARVIGLADQLIATALSVQTTLAAHTARIDRLARRLDARETAREPR